MLSRRRRRQTSKPSAPGSMTSRMTRSTGCATQDVERRVAILRHRHAVAVGFERAAHHAEHVRVVIDDEHVTLSGIGVSGSELRSGTGQHGGPGDNAPTRTI